MAESGSVLQPDAPAGNLLEELRAAYSANPADPKTASHLAEHYADLGWFNESIELYREVLAGNGNDYFLLLGYGTTCYRHRRTNEALETFRKLTSLQPNRIEGWNNSGIALLDLGRVKDAGAAFEKVLAIEPLNAGALINLGNCRARCGRHEDAVSLFEQAIDASPDSADAWFNLGNSRLSLEHLEKARAAFERALRFKREFPPASKNLGFTLAKLGEFEKALDSFTRAADLDPADAGIPVNMAGIYLEQDRIEEAKNCFIRAVRLEPGNIEAWRGLQRIAFRKGDLATYARCTIGTLPRLDDDAVAESIETLIAHGCYDDARTILAAADAGSRSGNELDSQRLVICRHFADDSGRCPDIYTRLCGITDPSDRILRALARYDFARENPAAVVDRIRAMQKPERSMQDLLIGALITLGRSEEALSCLHEFSEGRPAEGEFALLFAHFAIEEGRRSEAKTHLLQAIEGGVDFASMPFSSPELVSMLEDAQPDPDGGSG